MREPAIGDPRSARSDAVGLELALDPGPFSAVAVLIAAQKIGTADAWLERADLVRRAGTAAMVAGSAIRWFAPGFADREPTVADVLPDCGHLPPAEDPAAVADLLTRFFGPDR